MSHQPKSLTRSGVREPSDPKPASIAAEPALRRIGAVARMLNMPVATLRVWERRYGLTRSTLSQGGQRLYGADDVRRLALVKQLTDQGHAIGSLAPLDMQQLLQVASTHADVAESTRKPAHRAAAEPAAPRVLRLAVIGDAWGRRLRRPAWVRHAGPVVQLLGPFDSVHQAAAALTASEVDVVLTHEPQLFDGWLAAADAAAPSLAAVPKAVLYRFGADRVCDALAAAGVALLREPQPDAVVAQWLRTLAVPGLAAAPAVTPLAAGRADAAVPARRWDDATLASFAERSSTIACECPRHLAELLMQLLHFESYSAACKGRNAHDAALHADLQQVAAESRARFEAALERVALHEGLVLPPSPFSSV